MSSIIYAQFIMHINIIQLHGLSPLIIPNTVTKRCINKTWNAWLTEPMSNKIKFRIIFYSQTCDFVSDDPYSRHCIRLTGSLGFARWNTWFFGVVHASLQECYKFLAEKSVEKLSKSFRKKHFQQIFDGFVIAGKILTGNALWRMTSHCKHFFDGLLIGSIFGKNWREWPTGEFIAEKYIRNFLAKFLPKVPCGIFLLIILLSKIISIEGLHRNWFLHLWDIAIYMTFTLYWTNQTCVCPQRWW